MAIPLRGGWGGAARRIRILDCRTELVRLLRKVVGGPSVVTR
jgi:hypothetical protein